MYGLVLPRHKRNKKETSPTYFQNTFTNPKPLVRNNSLNLQMLFAIVLILILFFCLALSIMFPRDDAGATEAVVDALGC